MKIPESVFKSFQEAIEERTSLLGPNVPQCEHIHFNGLRCGCPAMRNKHFCYQHSRIRYQRPIHAMPLPDTPEAVNYAAQEIVQSLLDKRLTAGEARAAVYALRLQFQTVMKSKPPRPDRVVTEDPNEQRYRDALKEIGPTDQTGEATVQLVKDRVKFG